MLIKVQYFSVTDKAAFNIPGWWRVGLGELEVGLDIMKVIGFETDSNP